MSVSRVGGDAQTKAMKKASGAIRLELAQYREMEVFTQFSSDLDEVTKSQLTFGQGLMELLKQAQYHPMTRADKVILLVAALNHVMQTVPVRRILKFGEGLTAYVKEQLPDVYMEIEKSGLLTDENQERILAASKQYQELLKE